MKRQLQRGVALVLTLIMLSVITFLTVAFLTLSRRERGAATTAADQTTSRLAADTAAMRVQAEMVARMMAADSLLVGNLMVSRNFINTNGFDPARPLLDTNN